MSRRDGTRRSGLGTVDDETPAAPIDDDVETAGTPELRRARNRLLRETLGPFGVLIATAGLFVVLSAAATVAMPFIVQFGIDHGLQHRNRGALVAALVAFLIAALTDTLSQRVAIRLVGRTAEHAVYGLRTRLWSHVQGLSIDWFERQKAGRVISRATTDVDAVYELFSQGALALVSNVLTMIAVAAVLLYDDIVLAACVLGVIPLLMTATWLFAGRSELAYRAVREKIALVLVHLAESLTGIRVVQAFTREPINQAQFEDVNAQHLRANAETVRLMSVYGPSVELLGQCAIVLVLLVGGYRALDHSLTIGKLTAFLLALRLFFDPLQELSQFFNSFQAASAGLEKIAGVLDAVSTVPELPAASPIPAAPAGAAVSGAAVRLDHVTFSYGREVVLHDVDLTIAPGETLALMGATGAGKSTIAKLIARFYDPTEGRVLIDGHDLREVTTTSLRSTVAVVPQEAFLFSGTVHDNIALGRPGVSRAEVEAAAVAVGAHGFIVELPDGYDTTVDRRGARLSGGQRQLISFARAWVSDPRVLILDEATSALDLRSERLIQRALADLLADRTAVVIAHRLSSIEVADRVAVVENGCIVELGTQSELLDLGGRFRSLRDRWLASTTAGSR
jgi:ATP-binding cassette, subfamily B, bacterial